MNTEQLRAEFERWHLLKYMFEAVWYPDGGVYLGHAQGRWEAYQAGRAALQSQDRGDAERLERRRY